MLSQPNILIVTPDFQEFGHVFIYRQVMALKKFKPVVITWKRINSDKFPYDAIETLRYPHQFWKKISIITKPILNFDIADYLRRKDIRIIIQKYDPALIHIHFGWMASEYLKNYHSGTTPLLVTFHGWDIMTVPRNLESMGDLRQQIFNKADKLIFVSNFLKNYAIKIGCPVKKSVVNYLGAPLLSKKKIHTNRKHIQAICVARFVPCKGHQFLLETVKRVIDRGVSIKLELIGDGPLRAKILYDIDRLNLIGIVTYSGVINQDEVYKRLLSADLYVQHSATSADGQTEALGISIAEAMACGVPVIATRTGGIPELVVDGVTGALIDEYDVDGMANAIFNLSADAPLRSHMGKKARERIRKTFSIENGASNLEKIYDSILQKI